MKKLLVILMLGAGFVTTASANTPLICSTNPTNQCCVDEVNVQNKIDTSQGKGVPISGGYNVVNLNVDLDDDGSDGVCRDSAGAIKDGNFANGEVKWAPNNWDNTAVFY